MLSFTFYFVFTNLAYSLTSTAVRCPNVVQHSIAVETMTGNHIVKLLVYQQILLNGQDGLRPCLMNLGVLKKIFVCSSHFECKWVTVRGGKRPIGPPTYSKGVPKSCQKQSITSKANKKGHFCSKGSIAERVY